MLFALAPSPGHVTGLSWRAPWKPNDTGNLCLVVPFPGDEIFCMLLRAESLIDIAPLSGPLTVGE
jgi:hypothetical protein